jgi:hypothetical protein
VKNFTSELGFDYGSVIAASGRFRAIDLTRLLANQSRWPSRVTAASRELFLLVECLKPD